jgi:protein xylosyltransferase
VYLLVLSGRASRQIRRLIKQLYDGKNYFYIHVDSRHDYLYREMKAIEDKFPKNVYVTMRRFATIWGGTSLLTMLIESFRDLLNKKDWNWDFVINLSESDYPLKKKEDLISFLSSNRNKNFVFSTTIKEQS